ncbi:MAG: hypothetical protein H7Y20_07865, partial [Bryobacteraceae bacterium]|nr:hypothetical protein [Bryobacteraceae bacterium]
MITLNQQRNRQKLVLSAVTLAGVLVTAAMVQRNQTRVEFLPEPDQNRSRSAETIVPAVKPQPALKKTASKQTSQSAESEVRALVERWRSTLLEKNIAGHVACYAPVVRRYFRQANVNRAFVEKDKRRLAALWPEIRTYEISDLTISELSPDRAVATFRKEWDT